MFTRKTSTGIASADTDHHDLVLWTLRRQADALEGLLRLMRLQMGLTAEETLDVPWTPEVEPEPIGPPEDPNDAEVWISHASDERSARLEAEAEAARKRRPR